MCIRYVTIITIIFKCLQTTVYHIGYYTFFIIPVSRINIIVEEISKKKNTRIRSRYSFTDFIKIKFSYHIPSLRISFISKLLFLIIDNLYKT